MSAPTLRRDGDVLVLDLGDDENRFSPGWMAAVTAHLEAVERTPGPRALVTTASGRFFSNGLQVERLTGAPEERDAYLRTVERLLARVLALPVVTVAAVPGHAFGGGAMLALAHDLTVMRADRGFWCLPETEIGLSFTPGMTALVQARLAPRTAHESMVTSRRYGGADAAAAGIVDEAAPEDLVLSRALEVARAHAAKAADVLGETKARMHAEALRLLRG